MWDPNGWPFGNRMHKSTLESLAHSERWIDVNAALLNCADKVIFLRRRNQLARVVSDLLGQQTGLWGHDPNAPHSDDEAVTYRNELTHRKLDRLDENVIAWYLRHAESWEDRIMARVPEDRRLTVYYADLFGPEVDVDTRLDRVAAIANWLGIRMRTRDERVRSVFRPKAKFNGPGSYSRIPNFREIVSTFGEI